MQRIDIPRTALCVTQRCTLRCKLCLAFIPYYESPKDLTLEDTKELLKTYFCLADTVKTFTVTGGEPLMNKELEGILKEVYSHKDQITGSIDFITNGTLDIPVNILDQFDEHKDNTRIVLSDYGESLSSRIHSIAKVLDKRGLHIEFQNFMVMTSILMGGLILEIILLSIAT